MVEVKKLSQEGVEVLVVVGEVDASSSIQLDNAIRETLEANAERIIVDCKDLDYISSAGLGVFMSYIEQLREKNSRMILCSLNDKVKNVFEILGLDQLLETTSTCTDALEKLK